MSEKSGEFPGCVLALAADSVAGAPAAKAVLATVMPQGEGDFVPVACERCDSTFRTPAKGTVGSLTATGNEITCDVPNLKPPDRLDYGQIVGEFTLGTYPRQRLVSARKPYCWD